MDAEQLVRAARDAIGEGDSDDHVIAPTKHAAQLGAEAAPWATILQRSEVSTVAREYEEKDREAGQAQLIFKKTATRANWAVFLAASFPTVLLMTAPLAVFSTGDMGKWLQLLLGACGLLSGVAASFWLSKIRAGKLLVRWMEARAGAETRRLRYFNLVTGFKGDGQKSSLPLPLLQTEYFRRYQLDVQRTYYKSRATAPEQVADRMLTLSALAVGLGSFATGMTGLLGSAVNPQWISIAGLGAIAAALLRTRRYHQSPECKDMAAPEFPEYATSYSKNARALRDALSQRLRATLIEIEDELTDNPDKYLTRLIPLGAAGGCVLPNLETRTAPNLKRFTTRKTNPPTRGTRPMAARMSIPTRNGFIKDPALAETVLSPTNSPEAKHPSTATTATATTRTGTSTIPRRLPVVKMNRSTIATMLPTPQPALLSVDCLIVEEMICKGTRMKRRSRMPNAAMTNTIRICSMRLAR
jgi:hypothetical protein